MNMLDGFVTQVISKPYSDDDYWYVTVEYNCYGRLSITTIACISEWEANQVRVGMEILV